MGSREVRSTTAAVSALPAAAAIVDGEIVACDETGKPDFYTLLLRRAYGVCVWCFDLLGLNEDDLRPLPLVKCELAVFRPEG